MCLSIVCVASGLFAQTGVGYQFDHGRCDSITWSCKYDNNDIVNPKGVIEVGWEGEIQRVKVQVVWRHESMILAKDYGSNGVYINARWSPFRAR